MRYVQICLVALSLLFPAVVRAQSTDGRRPVDPTIVTMSVVGVVALTTGTGLMISSNNHARQYNALVRECSMVPCSQVQLELHADRALVQRNYSIMSTVFGAAAYVGVIAGVIYERVHARKEREVLTTILPTAAPTEGRVYTGGVISLSW